MASNVVIRECRADEADAVLRLWRDSETTVSVTDSVGDIRRAISQNVTVFLVAVSEGEIVGSIIGGYDGWRGNIYRLAVHPTHRRRGIARMLLAEAESRLVEMGVKRITALVEKDHPWAIGYWEAVGYELDAGMARYVRNL